MLASSANLLLSLVPCIGQWGSEDMGHFGVSFLEHLILVEEWAGHRLLSGLVISRFGPLPVRIRLLVVMLGLGLSAWVALLLPYLPLLPLSCRIFFRLGRAVRVTLPTGKGGVVDLFVRKGYQEAEEDSEKLQLIDKLLEAVLAEAQVVCTGQPLLIAGDLNADPAVIPCLAKGISAGKFVDQVLAYSLGAGVKPDATCKFKREDCVGSRRDFIVGCPNALAASNACFVTGRWFTPHFSVVARFYIGGWLADTACLKVCQPVWPACWIDTPDRSSSSVARVVQDVRDVYRDELGVVPSDVLLALRMRSLGLLLMIFGLSGARVLRPVFFRAYCHRGWQLCLCGKRPASHS